MRRKEELLAPVPIKTFAVTSMMFTRLRGLPLLPHGLEVSLHTSLR